MVWCLGVIFKLFGEIALAGARGALWFYCWRVLRCRPTDPLATLAPHQLNYIAGSVHAIHLPVAFPKTIKAAARFLNSLLACFIAPSGQHTNALYSLQCCKFNLHASSRKILAAKFMGLEIVLLDSQCWRFFFFNVLCLLNKNTFIFGR